MDNLILKVLVGSRAHGLNDADSDYDYRGVFVLPTEEILSLKNVGGKYKANAWFESKEDQTTYEIGHFLKLATKCNPSILEVFCFNFIKNKDTNEYTDKFVYTMWGKQLLELFPYVWNPEDAFNAFVGYSHNQRKKMLDKKDNREAKYASAYLRTLYNLECLLTKCSFILDVSHNKKFKDRLLEIRKGNFDMGSVINEATVRIKRCAKLRDNCTQKPDLDKVNNFLLDIRKAYWSKGEQL